MFREKNFEEYNMFRDEHTLRGIISLEHNILGGV